MESLVSATLLACFASVAIPVMVTSDTSDAAKMRHDVDCLNHLVSSYESAGGSLDGLNSPQAVLEKLQAGLTADASVNDANKPSTQVFGSQLSAQMQSTSEAQSHALRAVWDAPAHIFKIQTDGVAGVATFSLDSSLETRKFDEMAIASVTKPYNTANGWIWGKTSKASGAVAPPPTQYTLVETDNRFNPAKPVLR